MGFRAVRVEVHGQFVAVDGAVCIASLHPCDAHIVPRIGVLRVVRQRPLVQLDAARQIACGQAAVAFNAATLIAWCSSGSKKTGSRRGSARLAHKYVTPDCIIVEN